jgi:hypothetical protein
MLKRKKEEEITRDAIANPHFSFCSSNKQIKKIFNKKEPLKINENSRYF